MTSDKAAGSSAQFLTFAACMALCAPGPLSGLAQAGLAPVMPQIAEHFASDPNAGMLVRAMVAGLSGAMILGAVSAGYLAQRVGQLRLMMLSLAIFAVAGAAGFILDNLYLIVASRIVLGLVNAIAGVMAMAMLTTRVAPTGRERWMGFYIVGSTGGAVVSVILVGWVAAFSWRYAFLPYLAAIPAALFIAYAFPPKEDKPSAPQNAPASKGGVAWSTIFFGILFGATSSAAGMYVPFHLAGIGLGDPRVLAGIFAVSAFVGALASFAFGWVRLRLSVMQVFVVSLLLNAVAMFVIAAATTSLSAQLGMAISGAGIGLLAPNFFAAVAATASPERRVQILGQSRGAYYAGPLVAQPVLELVMNRHGSGAAVAGIAVIALVGMVLALIFRGVFKPFAEPQVAAAN